MYKNYIKYFTAEHNEEYVKLDRVQQKINNEKKSDIATDNFEKSEDSADETKPLASNALNWYYYLLSSINISF